MGRIVLDALDQRALLVRDERGRRRAVADGERVDGAGALAVGAAMHDAVDAAPADRDGHVLFAVDEVRGGAPTTPVPVGVSQSLSPVVAL